MMQKKNLIALWLLQDWLQILLLGFCLAPNLYLSYLLLTTTLNFYDDSLSSKVLLWAFVGGVLYDLRWTNVPGISALSWCLTLTVASIVWAYVPQNVRNYTSYFLLVFFALLFSQLINFVFSTTSRIFTMNQLLLNIVIDLLVAFIYSIIFMRNQSSDF